jgi:hypothetical protein
MKLKGASPDHQGDELADAWAINDQLVDFGARWDVAPADLAQVPMA